MEHMARITNSVVFFSSVQLWRTSSQLFTPFGCNFNPALPHSFISSIYAYPALSFDFIWKPSRVPSFIFAGSRPSISWCAMPIYCRFFTRLLWFTCCGNRCDFNGRCIEVIKKKHYLFSQHILVSQRVPNACL